MVSVTPDTVLPLEAGCDVCRVWTQASSHFRGNPSPCQHPSSLATVGEHRTLQSHIRRPTRPEYGVFDNVQHFIHDGQRAVLRICGVRDRLFKSPSPGKKYVDLSFTEAVMTPTVLYRYRDRNKCDDTWLLCVPHSSHKKWSYTKLYFIHGSINSNMPIQIGMDELHK